MNRTRIYPDRVLMASDLINLANTSIAEAISKIRTAQKFITKYEYFLAGSDWTLLLCSERSMIQISCLMHLFYREKKITAKNLAKALFPNAKWMMHKQEFNNYYDYIAVIDDVIVCLEYAEIDTGKNQPDGERVRL